MSKIYFVCSECKRKGSVESSDYDTETEVDEGGMGARIEYWTEITTECDCGHEINIMVNETEYPIGNIENEEVHSFSGADSAWL